MQGETERAMNCSSVSPADCGNNTSKLVHLRHRCHRSVLFGAANKRRKFSNAVSKSYWFSSKRSKIKLPTRFLLGGTIIDPLNLQGLERKCDGQADIHTGEVYSRILMPKHSQRISFPNVTDASDPLNLKNASVEEPQSLSNDCIASMKRMKAGQVVPVTGQALHILPFDENDIGSKRQCQCLDSSADVKVKDCPANNSFTSSERNQHCVQAPDSSLSACKMHCVSVEAACKITDNISDTRMQSVFAETEVAVCTNSSQFTSHDKIVSPAIPQVSRRKDRKRQRQGTHACKETVQLASMSLSRKNREKFPCGNYIAYYGYRNTDRVEDARLELLPKELFEGKEVLDIGCNAGIVTIAVASTYLPKSILGIDIDQRLISLAKRNVRRYMDENSYPSCLKTAFGPIAASCLPSAKQSAFPHNILFQVGDYIPSSDADLFRQCEEYDVILALSVSKWIHLTHGDAGLKRAFHRMFLQLRPGGKLVLEAQPWSSYRRKKKLTEKIYEVYQNISFKPEQFNDYLMSTEIGFSSCKFLGTPLHKSKGFQRSIYLFTKPIAADASSDAAAAAAAAAALTE